MHDVTQTTVRETIAEVLGISPDALLAEPELAAHEWDSLTSLHALAELEARLGVRFDLRTFHAARTVTDMAALATAAADRQALA